MFQSILTNASSSLTIQSALICTLASLTLGLLVGYIYSHTEHCSKNFTTSLVLLPILVQMVIMMVNGNLGTSVAVLGTFGLVRFRSTPGTSKEIVFIFLAMAIGLSTGMGYVTFAIFVTFITLAIYFILTITNFAETKSETKELKITIPENLDYNEIFDDVFKTYVKKVSFDKVRTVNMGSMYELKYTITLKDISKEKEMIDTIRCRNGNLQVVCSRIGSREDL